MHFYWGFHQKLWVSRGHFDFFDSENIQISYQIINHNILRISDSLLPISEIRILRITFIVDILFRQITMIIKVRAALVLGF